MPCVCCVDGTHVAISRPPVAHAVYPEHLFVNRHGYSSLNVQLVCSMNYLPRLIEKFLADSSIVRTVRHIIIK